MEENQPPESSVSAYDKVPSAFRRKVADWIYRVVAGTVAHPLFDKASDNYAVTAARDLVTQRIGEAAANRAIEDEEIMRLAVNRLVSPAFRPPSDGNAVARTPSAELAGTRSDMLQVAVNRLVADAAHAQTNLQAVALEAISVLENEASDVDPGETDGMFDEDWIDTFSRYAQRANSERLRSLFGKILAGEIVRSGSYSMSCIRLIAELDARQANAIRKLSGHLFGDRIYQGPDEWEMGDLFKLKVDMRSLGILYSQDVKIYLRLGRSRLAYVSGHDYIISVFGPTGRTYEITQVLLLTSAGEEVMGLLEDRNERVAAASLLTILRGFHPRKITISPRNSAEDEVLLDDEE